MTRCLERRILICLIFDIFYFYLRNIVIQFEYLRNIMLVIEFYVNFLVLASFSLSNYILNCIYQIKKEQKLIILIFFVGQQAMAAVVQPLP